MTANTPTLFRAFSVAPSPTFTMADPVPQVRAWTATSRRVVEAVTDPPVTSTRTSPGFRFEVAFPIAADMPVRPLPATSPAECVTVTPPAVPVLRATMPWPVASMPPLLVTATAPMPLSTTRMPVPSSLPAALTPSASSAPLFATVMAPGLPVSTAMAYFFAVTAPLFVTEMRPPRLASATASAPSPTMKPAMALFLT